jgi:hypothetical protein
VIRVVPADFAASRRGKKHRVVALAKRAFKRIRKRKILLFLRFQRVAIKQPELVVQFAVGDFFADREHVKFLLRLGQPVCLIIGFLSRLLYHAAARAVNAKSPEHTIRFIRPAELVVCSYQNCTGSLLPVRKRLI